MQTHGGQAAAEAIHARERAFSARLLVDWGRDGSYSHPLADLSRYVDKVKTDRTLSGSMPDELTLIEGASAAELTATLSGTYAGQSMVQVFAPYNGRSVFYLRDLVGCQVSYSLLLHTPTGTVEYPQFQGMVRSIAPSRGAGRVELECLDRVEVLRRPVSFPQWAIIQRLSEAGVVDAQLTDSQWIIDHCLRHCDTSPTGIRHTTRAEIGAEPDWRDGVHLWLTGTGSIMPTRGWMDNAEVQRFPHTEAGEPAMYTEGIAHPDAAEGEPAPQAFNGMAGNTGDGYENRYWAQDRDLMDAYGVHYLRLTALDDGSGYLQNNVVKRPIQCNIGEKALVWIEFEGVIVRIGLTDLDGVSRSLGRQFWYPDGYVDVVAAFDTSAFGTGVIQAALSINGSTEQTWTDLGSEFAASTSDDPEKGLCILNRRLPLQDVAWSFRNYYNASDSPLNPDEIQRDATYRAVLDGGRNRLSYMPTDQDGTDAWDIISGAASAEWGAVQWDERGVFQFWNYDTLRAKQTDPARKLTIDDVSGLSARHSLDSVRNVFNVEATKKVSVMGLIFEAQDETEFIVPGQSTKLFRVWDTSIISPIPYKVIRHTTIPNHSETNFPTWNDDVLDGYVVQFLIGGTWQEDNGFVSGVDIYAYWNIEGYLVINIQNGYLEDARLATDDGSPALHLRGTSTVESDPQVFAHRYDESIAAYGERNLKLSGSWYQDGFASARMLDTMAGRTTRPVPVTDDIAVPGDPRLQLADPLEIYDPEGFGEQLRVQILGTQREFDKKKGLADTHTVELIRPPGRWVLGSPTYSVLGRSTVLTSGPESLHSNPTFERGIQGWEAYYGGTVAHTTEPAYTGSGAMKITPDGSAYAGFRTVPFPVEVSQGDSCTARFYAYSPNGWDYIGIEARLVDSAGNSAGYQAVSPTFTADLWVEVTATVTATEAAAVQAEMTGYLGGTPSDAYFVDVATFTHGPTA